MFIPETVEDVLQKTLQLARANDKDVPERDRMNALENYDTALEWLSAIDTSPAPDFDREKAVEVGCTVPEPGDLFRPVAADDSHVDTEWKQFLGGDMTPNETWYFAMAYAAPATGVFEGVHFAHDSNYVELLTMCRACGDQQAEVNEEVIVNANTIARPVCTSCHAETGE